MANVLVSPKHRKLLIKDDQAVANIAPQAVRKDGYLLLDHGAQETRLLRNLGYNAPAPILSQYDWCGTTPFESQRETAALLTMNRRAYVLNTMGTGKTRAALFASDFLMTKGHIHKVLVVAPLSTLTPTWMNELFFHFHHRKATVLHGSKKKRVKLLAEDCDYYIINHDGLQVLLPELMARTDIDCVVLDELAMYREAKTDRWKLTKKIVGERKVVWGLTGAPTPNAPTDAWAQIKLLQPHKADTYGRFRDATMRKITNFKWVARDTAAAHVHAAMQPSVRYTLEDCWDIPETTYTTREVAMSPTQSKFYKRMNSAANAAYLNHTITAANEAVVMGKLLQISCGWVYSDKRVTLGLQPTPKLSELDAILQEVERKVIVFVPYHNALLCVADYLSKITTVEVVHGKVSKKERDRIFYEYQKSDKTRVIVAHPRTMSHGLTLTESSTIVWYGPPASLDTYIQANARIVRAGQFHKTNIIHLQSTPIEKKVYSRIQRNEVIQGSLLSLYEGVDDRS